MQIHQKKVNQVLKNITAIEKEVEQGINLNKHLKYCQTALVEINHSIDTTEVGSEEHLSLRNLKLDLYALIYDIKNHL